MPGSAVYAASKAGVVGLTRSLAAELGPSGIRSNVIVPGYIETDMTARMTETAREKALRSTPLGRFGHVEEIADAAVFVAENGYVNGAEIVVDGGLGCT
jgi:NAD(P)-dependent dehydrogenase (short-subunit alcohol dehydrogenase family)